LFHPPMIYLQAVTCPNLKEEASHFLFFLLNLIFISIHPLWS